MTAIVPESVARGSLLDQVVAAAHDGLSAVAIAELLSITPGLVETMVDHGKRSGRLASYDLSGCAPDAAGCTPGAKPGCAGCPLMPVESLLGRLRRIAKSDN